MSQHLSSYSDTLFLTIQWALQDRRAMLEALSAEPEKQTVLREIRAIKRLRKRAFGDLESKEESFARNAVRISVGELLNRIKDE
jgi:hypothetical protein